MPVSDRTSSDQAMSLGDRINAETRGIHADTNKVILSQLPKLLPPHAADPSIYASGLLHIAPIYLTFEGLWHRFLTPDLKEDIDLEPLRPASGTVPVENSPLPSRVHSSLHALLVPGLARGGRLKADIQALTGWSDLVLETQLELVSGQPALAAIIERMTASIQKQPLLIVTYTYILYMALFAGGRIICKKLKLAGDDFWQTPLAPIKPTMQLCIPVPSQDELPLSFFRFDNPNNGEDLKVEYKRILKMIESAIDSDEADAIVGEATNVFRHILSIEELLEAVFKDDPSDGAATMPGEYLQPASLLSRVRNSVAVAKERYGKSSPGTSSSEADSAGTVIRRRNYRSSASSDSHSTDSAASEHPPMPAVTGVELCPAAVVRSVRFNSALSLPQQQEQTAWAGRREQIKTADLTSCVLAALLGIVAMGVILVSRRGAAA
ncbi:hem oxygenase-like, multi-helical [Cordyceps fumosorosea ARSEF 2679]|uniref:Hem oxygenase-like, multi-helical n=1 Tax=Cordyceps fumosorosea (strain ARSEF 2679) TaxID=1081104 RepID=A0A168DFI5_CORFA|nr:hem oxygenase-like, multi-helical [Cordyceps fumosorosea ARSEF 2679]OAA72548.1 hem oxygenase-like, multi-helical [Cordyceps fumosorosea ARSEF 2679]